MLLTFSYYLRHAQVLVNWDCFWEPKSSSLVPEWDDNDIEGYKESSKIKADIYSLKRKVLAEYIEGYGYGSEVVENQELFEMDFENHFIYWFRVSKDPVVLD
jgi:hypothetical protein